MLEHVGQLPGIVAKNLFMRDKKKKGHWLLSARHDRPINLNELAKQLDAKGGLRLADESVLQDKLGVTQGCVTPFALLNDRAKQVTFVIDEDLLKGNHEFLYFHPMTNAATTGITPMDLEKFLEAVDHKPYLLKFETSS